MLNGNLRIPKYFSFRKIKQIEFYKDNTTLLIKEMIKGSINFHSFMENDSTFEDKIKCSPHYLKHNQYNKDCTRRVTGQK